MALSTAAWAVLVGSLIVLPGVAVVALVKTLRAEDRKLDLLDRQGDIEGYSPEALAELREWIERNPGDPYAPLARERYNECVDTLREVDEPFYDWSESEIESLERL